MNKPCSHCGGKVMPHVKKNKELLHVCVECGVIIARENLSSEAAALSWRWREQTQRPRPGG